MYDDDVAARRGITRLALKGFFNLAERWELSRPEAMTLLGLTATSTYANWKNNKTSTIPRDTIERISYLITIDDILKNSFASHKDINQWLRQATPPGWNCSPMDVMMQGNVIDIHWVQQQLQTNLKTVKKKAL